MPNQAITQSTLPQAPIKPFTSAPSTFQITPASTQAPPSVTPTQNVSQPTSGLDPKIVNLAQAIRQTESQGNFQAQGKSGEYGAYQFMPSTWAGNAPRFGVNVPLDQATPAQQNEVAYKQLQEWSQQHPEWNVGNFASAWNAGPGKPDAYQQGNVGTNSKGVNYDTPAYAQKVAEAYQQFKAQNAQNAPVANVPQGMEEAPSLGGFGGNIIKSGANFLGNLGQAVLHPIDTVQNIGGAAVGGLQELGGQENENTQKFDALKDYFVNRYKSPDALLQTAYSDPVGLAADISTLFGVGGGIAGVAGKGAELAGLADTADVAGNVASKLGKASELTNPLTPVIKGTGAVLSKGSSVIKPLASQFTEISPNGMQDIFNHPQDYSAEAISNTSRLNIAKQVETALSERESSLSETGGGYKPIVEGTSENSGVSANGKNAIPVEHDFLENQLRTVANLDVKDGKIIPTTVSKIGKAEVSKLQDVLDTFKPAFQSGHISPEEFLALRSRLADAAYNDSGIKNTKVAKLAEDVRNNLNTTYRGAIPGLEELDNSYSGQLSELKDLRKGFIDKEGNLTQTAIAKIANAGNKDLDLQRLEKIVPGITRQLTALKVMEEIKNASGIKVGTYAKSITEAGGAIAGLATGNIPMLAGSLALAMVTSPKVVVPLIRFLGENKELIPAVMANLAKYATTNSNLSQATSQKTAPTQPTQGGTQNSLQTQSPSEAPNLSSVSSLDSLASSKGFDLAAARKAGYSDQDIQTFLSQQ